MVIHAKVSPSSSEMWLKCPPSATKPDPNMDEPSIYAEQGTEAHACCEYRLKTALGMEITDPRPNMKYYDEEMENCAEDYTNLVLEKIEEAKCACSDPVVLIEQKLYLQDYIPDGYGYGDCVIIADGTLQVIDYKHGLGVLVSSERNTQMMCFALGALKLVDCIYDISNVAMTIVQPRRANISTYEMTVDELLTWGEEVLKPIAKLAYDGEGEYVAGEHCRFCKAKATCRARADYNMELAKFDFTPAPELESDEIAEILEKADELISWAGDVKADALSEALKRTNYPGFKIVEGRSVRKYTDEQMVAEAVAAAGIDPYEKKLLGITAMTSKLGRKRFDEILGSLVYKAPGKPALVSVSDKRPAMNTAADDFKENEYE